MPSILGQHRALEILGSAVGSGHVHHAWIFSGPRGVGKFTTAAELAKILLDPAARTGPADAIEADPASPVAEQVDAGTHPDFRVIRKELALVSENPELRRKKLMNIPLDLLREWLIGGRTSDGRLHEGPAYRKACLGHGKVLVIDEAELVDSTGQGALLKTLEEPPPETYLVLVTSAPERLLPTVRSRCQHVRFERLDETAMRAWFDRLDAETLQDWSKRNGCPIDGAVRDWIIQFADGAPGIAQLAADYGFHGWQRKLDPMLAQLERGGFPAALGAALAELIESFAVAWVARHKNASKDAANKDGVRHVLSLLAAHARHRLAETCDGDADPAPWLAAIDAIHDAERQIFRNVNLKHALENLVVQWGCGVGSDEATGRRSGAATKG